MSWAESAKWYNILVMAETVVLTLCTWFFLSRAEQETVTKKGYRFGAFLLYWAGFAGITFGFRDSSYTNLALPVFMVVMTAAAGCGLYNRRRIYRFYYFLYPVTVLVAQIFIGYLVLGYFSSRWGAAIFDYYLMNVTLIVRMLTEILLTGIWTVLLNRKKYEDVKGIRFAGLFLPPAVSMFIIFSLICIGNVFLQLYGAFLIILDILFLVVMNVYIWFLFSYQSKNKKLEAELKIRRKQSELQYQYYEMVEQQYQSSRKMLHDMRNHLQAMEALSGQDAAKGKAYMKDMHEMLDSLTIVNYTDNRMLNIILNDKAKAAKSRGIEMDVRIGPISLAHIRDMDITTVFANLLDNALEAAEYAAGERWIKIRMDMFHDFVVVKLRNSTEPLQERERRDTGKHMGVGLENVRHTLERYGGGILTETAGDEFRVSITIPVIHEA